MIEMRNTDGYVMSGVYVFLESISFNEFVTGLVGVLTAIKLLKDITPSGFSRIRKWLSGWLLIFFVFHLCSGCVTYQKCKDKYMSSYMDTIKVSIPVSIEIPKDSVFYSFKDSITNPVEKKQGRARVLISRDSHGTTKVSAICDPVVIERKVRANCPPVAVFKEDRPLWKRLNFWLYVVVGVVSGYVLNELVSLKRWRDESTV